MDFDEYVAARYGRLIEHAVLLGAAEGEAGVHVDRVLIAERRRIQRAKDPDPLVRAALERDLSGEPARPRPHRHGGPLAAVALVAGIAVVGVVATYQPAPGTATMPSLFGLDAGRAQSVLSDRGLTVQIDKVAACEPLGEVVGSQPEPGTVVEEGTTVHVRTSLPTSSSCIPDYDDRVDAWAFLSFVRGGPAPKLAAQVRTVLVGTGSDATVDRTLTGADVEQADTWDVLTPVADAAEVTTKAPGAMPRLGVESVVPPGSYCGFRRPDGLGGREALRLTVDTTSTGRATCPLTVDLYRRDRVIDTVVVYPAA